MRALRGEELLGAARVAAALSAGAVAIAIAVHLTAAAEAREALRFSFPGVPNRLGEAAGIFLNNARVLLAVLAACLLRRTASGLAGAAGRAVAAICDLALLVGCGFQVLVLGAAVGAYGGRTLGSIAAHGPFELAAFSLALALYLEARRTALAPRRLLATAAIALACLAVGALLETFA
jgi:hypothetical protein